MKRVRLVSLVVVSLLLAVGCGNRLSRDEILAQNTVSGSNSGAAQPGDQGGDGGASRSGGDATAGSVVTNAAPGDGAASAGQGGGTSAGGPGGGSAATGSASGAGAAPTGSGTGTATKAPIVFGLIGYLSGLGGSTLSPARDAFVAWQRSVNARGGINGHPVQLLIGDYGGNDSRAVAIARDFVENKGAIALSFIGIGIPFAAYAKSKSVPVVGTTVGVVEWNNNPMLFPQNAAAEGVAWGSARLMKRAGVTKIATVYCAESSDCQTGRERTARYAAAEGLQVVYSGQYSETQPDFTAECLRMKGSGAEAVYPTGSTDAMIRMAQSCGRQAFHPIWVAPTSNDALAKLPEFERSIGVTPAFPWFLRSGSPAVVEYADALQKYAPKRLTDGNTFMSWAWLTGKTLEKAAEHVSDKPTSQEILEGLWSMKGETLGGLATGPAARTFTRGQPTPETFCVYETRVQNGQWVAPQGVTPICR